MVCKNGVCDTTYVIIPPSTAKNDTVVVKPTCPTCPVTQCAIQNDISSPFSPAPTSGCGTPAGYTVTGPNASGCVTLTPNGTVKDTAKFCIVTCSGGKCDTTVMILVPPTPSPDTVISKPTCPTCPVTTCPVNDDIDTTGANRSTCPMTPTGLYTQTGPDVNGCYSYTPNGAVKDTVTTCIITCTPAGRCDTTLVKLAPPTPTPDTVVTPKPTCPTCPVTVCAVNDDVDTTGATSTLGCGTPSDYTVSGPTPAGCITVTPSGSVKDTAKLCVVTCKAGRCDTSYILIPPPTPTPDTITTQPKCPTCPDTVCAVNDDVNLAGSSSISICGNPAGYTMVGPDANGCVILTPNGAVTGDAKICIKTCDTLGRCDTTVIIVKAPTPTPDTVVVKPTCPTCPVNACAVSDDVTLAGSTSTSSCGTPPNYTLSGPNPSGCITATPNGVVKDTAVVCIKTCDNTGRCDTTYVIILPPTPTPDTVVVKPTCDTCSVVACTVVDDVDTTGATRSECPLPPGSGYTRVGPDANGCYTYTANGTVKDTVKTCQIVCDGTRCDTTVVILPPPPTTPDTVVTPTPTCPTCPVTACAENDDIDTTGATSTSTCGTPAGYTLTGPTPAGCVTLTPNGTVKDTAKLCVVTCNKGRCDTSYILIPPPTPTPDTVAVKPTCPTCPITACGVNDDVDTTGATRTTCPITPTGSYTATGPDANGCMTYTPSGTVKDTATTCIITCTPSGRCDTTYVKIVPPTSTPDTVVTPTPSCPTCPVTACAENDDVDTTGATSTSTCGTPAGYTLTGPTPAGCVTLTPNGTIKDTAKLCVVTCNNGRCDTSYILVPPPTPTPDTVVTPTPSCPTCPVTACAVNDDIDTTGATSSSTCGTPAGYTLTGPTPAGCVTLTPTGTVKDTAKLCVVTCKNGRCDTSYILVPPPTPTPDTVAVKPTCPTCPITACGVNDDIDTTGATRTTCPITPAGSYTETGPDANGCMTYTPSGTVKDTATTCIITCTPSGRCDTTYVKIVPPTPTPDTVVATKPACPTCPVTACAENDDVDTTGASSTSTCGTPAGYTLSGPSPAGCVTLTPTGSVKDTAKVCVVTCKAGRCDTSYIMIPPPTPTPDTTATKPTCPTCPVTVCGVNDDINTAGATSTNPCPMTPSGLYTQTGPDASGCFTFTPNGSVKDTVKTCIVTCTPDGRCDTTYVVLVPPTPTPDTVNVIPSCPTCPITACAVNDDINAAGRPTNSVCGNPAGYTMTGPDAAGCVTLTPNGTVKDTAKVCLVTCQADGRCDTSYIVIAPPTPTPDTVPVKPSCATCPVTACAVNDDINGTGATNTSPCGAPAGYTMTGPTPAGCVTLTPTTTPKDTVKTCIVSCTPTGRCDTSYIIIAPPTPTPDTVVTPAPSCPTCPVSACAVNDDVDTTGASSTSTCGTPAGYTLTGPSPAGCVTLTPTGSVKDTAKLCVVTCKAGRCDTSYIMIPPPTPTPDTVVTAKPSCPTCPVTACAVNDDINSPTSSTSTCGTPAGYTITGPTTAGCVTLTPTGSVKDTAKVCVVSCVNGRCDTSYIMIPPPTPTPDTTATKPTCPTCPVTVCGVNDDINTAGATSTNPCPMTPSGLYTQTGPDASGCFTFTPNGSVKDTVKTCIVTCTPDGRCDTTYVVLVPPTPTPDTVMVTPSCPTCPVTACAVNDDINATGRPTTSFCGNPTGYTMTGPTAAGCVTLTPNGTVKDTVKVCLVTCQADGRCDTTYVILPPPVPSPDTVVVKPTCATCPVTACAVNDDINGTGATNTSPCGAPAGFTMSGPDAAGCVTLTPTTTPKDTVKTCIVSCTSTGRCDTTYVIVVPPTPTPDTVVTPAPSCPTCPVSACAVNDDVDTTGASSTSTCGTPAGYTLTGPSPAGCVTLTPTGSVKDTAKLCVVTCKNGRCDTSYILIPPPTPTPDTVVASKPTCPTCPVTACAVNDDINSPTSSTSTCGTPAGYTMTGPTTAGCVTLTPTGSVKDTAKVCVVSCVNGRCDTSYILIPPPTPTPDTTATKPTCPTCPVTVCGVNDDINTAGATSTNPCPMTPSGLYTQTGPDASGCFTFTPNGSVKDTVKTCIVTCTPDGRCDTTYVTLVPPTPTPDTVMVTPSCPTCPVTACAVNDDINATGRPTTSFCGNPTGYTMTGPTAAGCVTLTPNGTVKDTAKVCLVTCQADGRCDTTYVILPPPVPSPDTVVVKPTCATCPVTACAVNDDINGTGATNTSPCGAPAGFTMSGPDAAGCVTLTPTTTPKDTVKTCIVSCTSTGRCDTTYVIVVPPTPTPDTVVTPAPSCPTCPVSACAVNDDVDTTGASSTSTCGTPAGYTLTGPSPAGCVTLTPTGSVKDTAKLCVVTCKNGRCDTSYILIPPPTPTPDTVVASKPTCPTCPVTACAVNDDINSPTSSTSTCGTPAGYTMTGPTTAGCVTLTPTGSVKDTAKVCVVSCVNGRCDTSYILIPPPTPTPDTTATKPTCPTCPVTVCGVNDDINTAGATSTNPCPMTPSGLYTQTGPDASGCFTFTPNGSVKDTVKTCIVTCTPDGRCDTTYVVLVPPTPTPDTVMVTPTCPTCPVTACAVNDDINATGRPTTSFCGNPTGYTMTGPTAAGCVTLTPNGTVKDTVKVCLVTCQADGRCDTTYVILPPPVPSPDTVVVKPSCATCPVTACAVNDDINGTGATNTSPCGAPAGFTMSGPDAAGCVTLTPTTTPKDTVKTCIVSCTSTGRCDTTYVIVVPPTPTPDTVVTPAPSCPTCPVSACAVNDDVDTTGASSTSTCGTPAGYTLTGPSPAGCVTLTPTGSVKDTAKLCVVTCKAGRCDTSYILIPPPTPTPDTVVASKPTCPTCPVTACAVNDDINSPTSSTSTCGTPAGYTMTGPTTAGCVTLTPTGSVKDTAKVCVVSCVNGRCDTSYILIPPPTPTPDTTATKPTCPTCPVTVCGVNDDINTAGATSTNPCPMTPSGLYTQTGPDASGCFTFTPNGSVKDTVKTCIVTCTPDGRCDTTYVVLVPPTPTPDTVMVTPSCPTCPVTACAVNDDINATGRPTTSFCGNPTGYTMTGPTAAGCVTLTPNGTVKDTVKVCLVTCQADGRCDTTYVILPPPVPSPDTVVVKPTCATCPVTACAVNDDINGTGATNTSPCGAPAGFTMSGPDAAGCVTLTPTTTPKDTVKTCIVSCTSTGRCDTTYVIVVPPTPTPDTVVTPAPSCPTCPVSACAVNDDVDTTGASSTSTCGTPAGYTLTGPSPAGCVTLTPNGMVKDTAKLCVVTCKAGRCDTSYILIPPPTPTPDTVVASKPTCPTCPVTACAVNDDINSPTSSTSTCGTPAGYTMTGPTTAGCVTLTPTGSVKDTAKVCVVSCVNGRCDTSYILIPPPTPTPDTTATKPTCPTCPVTVCGVNDDINTAGATSTNPCPMTPSGLYTQTGPDASGCFTFTPNGSVKDTVKTCIVTCTPDGRCDTTYVVLVPPTPTPDTVMVTPSCPTCPVTACAVNDDINATGRPTTSFCGNPTGYTMTGPTAAGCVTLTPNGTVKDTVKVCLVTCQADGRCDTTYVILPPPVPSPDTVVVKPTCATCPVTACAVNDDINGTGATNTSPCGAPAGFTMSGPDAAGCVTLTPTTTPKDTVKTCIVSCTSTGRCDTTYVIVVPPTPTPDTVVTPAPSCPTCPVSACAVNDDVDTTGASSTSTCGTPAGYTLTGPSPAGCVTLTPTGSVKDTAKLCVVTCKAGRCDTSYILIPPPTPTPDTVVASKPTCPTCPVTACAVNDDINSPTSSTSTCGTPAGYTMTGPTTAGCVTLTPTGSVKDTAKVCVVSCVNGRCDTSYILIPPPTPTPDSILVKPSCPTCPVTACGVNDDIDTAGSTRTTCPLTPTGLYTQAGPDVNGCFTYTPNGSVKDTVTTCIVTCTPSGRCDTTYVKIAPPTPTPDTVMVTPSCPTCPVTACAVNDDINATGRPTNSVCGTPNGYTTTAPNSSGCVTLTPNGTVKDTVKMCLVTCQANGRCDTTYVILPPPVPTPDTVFVKPTCPTCPVTACAVMDDINSTGASHYDLCGTPTGYAMSGPTSAGCVTLTPNGSIKDTVKACMISCTPTGRCDTTYVIVVPPTPTPDTIVTPAPSCPTCPVSVCAVNDDVDTTGASSTSKCGTPPNYTMTGPSPAGCVTLTPNGMVKDTAKLCVVTCKAGRCDTSYILIPPPAPTPDTVIASKPTCPTCPVTVCAVNDDVDTTGASSTSKCGTPAGYTMSGPTPAGCVTLTPDGTVKDTVKLCVVTCKAGRCDTSYILVPPADPTPDTVVGTPKCATCPITLCVVKDDLVPGTLDSTKTCGTPAGYTASAPDANGCVVYTPLTSPAPTAEVKTCIVSCKNGRCDTTYVFIKAPLQVDPDPDTATVASSGGTTPSIILNDTTNGVPTTLGPSGNSTVQPDGGWPGGLTLDLTNGKVNVPAGTTPGVYKLPYILCDTFTPRNCKTDTMTLTVTPVIDPDPDTATVPATGGTTPSIVVNDTTNGNRTTIGTGGNSTIAPEGVWPNGLTLNPTTGGVTVPAGTTPGVYKLPYTLCDTFTPKNCKTDTVTLTVTPVIDPDPDTATIPATGGTTPSIVLNDTTNGKKTTIGAGGNSTIAQDGVWPNGLTLNPTTGGVTVPAGTTPGVYKLPYTLCDTLTPKNCKVDTVKITVTPVIDPDPDTATMPSTGGTTPSIVLNDTTNGVQTTLGPTGNSTITPSTVWPNGMTLDSITGGVKVPSGTAPGVYKLPYTLCDKLTPKNCKTDTVTITVVPATVEPNPDVNATFVNVPVSGSLNTNDKVPTGTTYGSPVAITGNPSASLPIVNSDGTYTFTSAVPGVYEFNVPVCPPGITTNCPVQLLKITVLDPSSTTNTPVANTDIAVTKGVTPVTLNTLGNDKSGNLGTTLVPSSVTVVAQPKNGTTSVDPSTGNITYTAKTGFTGKDTLKYSVCDNSVPAKCTTAYQIITVLPTTAPNTVIASDDYNTGPHNTPQSGNVKSNDIDPEGNSISVTPQTTTIAGKGTLVLNGDGTYIFTPVSGFSGPVDFPYSIVDNGSPVATASATLHVLVPPIDESKLNPDVNATFVNVPVSGSVKTNDKVPAGTTYGSPTPIAGNPNAALPTVNPDGSYTFTSSLPGVYQFNVPVCPPGQTVNCPIQLLTITVLDPNSSTNTPVANTDIATTKGSTPVTLNTLGNDKSGNSSTNLVPSSVFVTEQPKNGAVTVDPITGNTTYTPKAGFTGMDTLKYTVCDNNTPGKCATAYQIITVLPTTAPNTVVAADDYNSGPMNKTQSGNVRTNDSDPEGDIISVVPQSTTIPGKGTLVLNADGTYVFTPVSGFSGPVDFPYSIFDDASPSATANATLHLLITPISTTKLNPDVNVTYVNVQVVGNVSTNDNVPSGTIYGSPTALVGNPTAAMPIINPDGSYTFTSAKAGVYYFNVPVCPPGVTTNCPVQLLTITVLDPDSKTNTPVANTDIATTKEGKAVVLNTLDNDLSGNDAPLNPASVAVVEAPKNGKTSVDPTTGKITYTPNPGFVGVDTLKYKVCDQSSPVNCITAYQIITVLPTNSPNITTASDDYNTSNSDAVSGNVLDNDVDPEGNTQSVTPQTTTIPGKGTLVLNVDGSYVFTPEAGFTGPVNFPYTVCDNGSTTACAKGTLYILVKPGSDLVLPNYFSPNSDGGNDAWILPPSLYAKYPNLKAIIYNRWGNIVWRSVGAYRNEFAGTHWTTELPLPDGVYYYLLELEDEFKKTMSGFVEIMRR